MTRREREVTDANEIKEILDSCKYLHLGLSIDDKPYVVTLNYGYEWDETDGHLILYLHSATNARMLEYVSDNANCSFAMECNVRPFEGKVACQYGMAYESIMGYGQIVLVEDVEERILGLQSIMKAQTGKGDFAFDERMVSIVKMFRVDVTEFKAKRRELPETLRGGECHGKQ